MTALVAIAALLLSAPPAPAAASKLDGKAAFEQLKKLEGTWKADGKDGPAFLQLRVVSNGTAVLETVTGADKTKIVMTSIYSLDGSELVMSHYGSEGNVPHMKLKSADGKDLKFEAVTVTNLPNPAASHMNAVALLVKDNDHLTQEWENVAAGKSVKLSFPFAREFVDTLK